MALRSGKLDAARRDLEDAAVDWCSTDRQLELARGLRHLAQVEEVIGTSDCQTTLEEARQLNVALDSCIGMAQVESVDALVVAREVDSQHAHGLLQSSLERMQAQSAIHDVHELCVIAALV